jgi:hypothetical protein
MANRIRSPRLYKPLRPVSGQVTLFLKIRNAAGVSKLYRAVPLHPHPEVARKAWQLQQAHGVSYHVWSGPDGSLHCDCADANYRGHLRDGCKHSKAMSKVGLI